MVKMLNHGGHGLGAVARHFTYLNRNGELAIETDEGEELKGTKAAGELVDDWDLELEESRPTTADNKPRENGRQPRLVHKMIFSMPAGTPPTKVLQAVKGFAREEFGAKHRYAMVLHTDQPHPHVHLVVKAMGHDGRRLNIRHATLREWRREFARHLRQRGVAANATERQVRGVTVPQKPDGIYRAALRGASTHWRKRGEAVATGVASRGIQAEPGKAQLFETRGRVTQGWSQVAEDLDHQDLEGLAAAVRRFVKNLPPVRTEREWIRDEPREQARQRCEHIR